MRDVFLTDFLKNVLRRYPEGVQTVTGQFAKEVAEIIRAISWEGRFRDLAVSCLTLDPVHPGRI